MSTISEVHITLCDHLNAGFGYQIRVVDQSGRTILFTSRDPSTGRDLLTYDDALRVAVGYGSKPV